MPVKSWQEGYVRPFHNFPRPIAAAFGATGEMLDNCVVYGRIILCTLTAFMLQNVFQSFLVTAERPQLGLAVTVAADVANMALDFVFIAAFPFFTALGNGVVSAAISFLRTLLFQVAAVLVLPLFFGIDGIWLSIVAAELLALVVTATFFIRKRDYYHYA